MLKSVKLLVGGEEAFDTIITNINQALVSIKVNMFIWRDDLIGNQMAEALIDAANRGVKVYISKDRLGMLFEYSEETKQSFFHHNKMSRWYIQSMMLDSVYPMKGKGHRRKREPNPNYEIMKNHPNIKLDCDRVKKDHSKYYIFDNEILVLGGINIEDKEVTADVSGRVYHDYMVEIRDRKAVKLFKKRLFGNTPYNEDAEIEFVFNRRKIGNKDFQVKESIIKLLSKAERTVDIVMAYIGDEDINNIFVELINKGVTISLYLPSKANLQHDLNMKNLKELMIKTDNKIHVYLSDKMIHAKMLYIDKELLTLGSTNLNNQAMEGLLELNVVLKDNTQASNVVFLKLEESVRMIEQSANKINNFEAIKFNQTKAYLESLV